MKIEIVPNKGPASMGAELIRNLEWAEQIDIASAFITPKSLKLIEAALIRAKKNGHPFRVRILFGLYQRFTPPEALSKLLNLQRNFPGLLFSRLACNRRFHWKLYLCRKGNLIRVYIGSANLTDDGLNASGELSIKLITKAADASYETLQAEFDSQWQYHSIPLTQGIWKKYKRVKRPVVTYSAKDKKALDDIFESPDKPPSPVLNSPHVKPRIVFMDENLREETEEIIRNETDWEKHGWGYFSDFTKRRHDLVVKAGIFLYVTWFSNAKEYWLEFRKVKDEATLSTPDGEYFIAHSRIPRAWCVNYNDIKQELSRIGLKFQEIKRGKQLTNHQLQEVCRLLHVRLETLLKA